MLWFCHAKIGPLKIGLAELILAEKHAKTGLSDHFCCQNWSGQTDFGCKNWSPYAKISPPMGTYFGKKLSAKIGHPHKVALLFMRVHGCMDVAITTSSCKAYASHFEAS